MSYFTDRQEFDPDDWDEDRTVICKFCGKSGLFWNHNDVRWELIDEDDKPHNCRRSSPVDDFS